MRGLSVNDCPASAVAKESGIELTYGTTRVMLPAGGGVLERVTLSRPPFARRMELVELGLVFRRPTSEKMEVSVVHCSRGWGGDAVRLENVPAGKYTVRWTGKKRVLKRRVTVPKAKPRRRR